MDEISCLKEAALQLFQKNQNEVAQRILHIIDELRDTPNRQAAAHGHIPEVSRTSAPHDDYPRFELGPSALTKTTWNQKTNKEHRVNVPISLVRGTAKKLLDAGPKARLVEMGRLLQSGNGTSSMNQVYIALEWFRTQGWAEKGGRKKHRVLDDEALRRLCSP